MGRLYTMIEHDQKYVEFGQKRLDSINEVIGDVENAVFDIKPIKVSMKQMVEANYFTLGEQFIHENGEVAILASADGKLEYRGKIASMHEIAGLMMKSTMRKNGFEYFYVYREDKLVSIDLIRNNFRKVKML